MNDEFKLPAEWAELAFRKEQLRADYETSLPPMNERSVAAERAAVDFARDAIRSCILLNGGGLVAIPAVATFFHLKIAQEHLWVFAAAGIYVVGLLFGALSSLAAFCSMQQTALFWYQQNVQQTCLIKANYIPIPNDELNEHATEAANAAKTARRKATRWQRTGAWLATSSIWMFIVASSFAAYQTIVRQSY